LARIAVISPSAALVERFLAGFFFAALAIGDAPCD
jgi:hypothetical protein